MGGQDEWDLSDDMDMDDLFEDGDAVGVSGLRRTFELEAVGHTEAAFASVIELASELELRYALDDDEDGTVYLRGALANRRDKPVEIETLTLLARGADGRILDYGDESLHTTFSTNQELVCDFDFYGGVIGQIAQLDILASYTHEFQRLASISECEAPKLKGKQKARVPIALHHKKAPPKAGEPEFDCDVTAYVRQRWDDYSVRVLVELTEVSANREGGHEVLVALRDEAGRVIGKEDAYGDNMPGRGRLYAVDLEVAPKDLSRIRRIDVGVKGTVERTELLRAFKVSRPD